MRMMIGNRLSTLLLSCLLAASAAAGEQARFRPASAIEPVIGRYVVAFAGDEVDAAATAAALARAYGGRLEPFAAQGFLGMAITMRPSQARTLSNDPRVAWVEERPTDALIPAPRASAPVTMAATATAPVTATEQWTTTATAWSSGEYSYDGAGNIRQIGNDVYRYDLTGRLSSATAMPQNQQEFTYDPYGNLTTVTTHTAGGTLTAGFAVDTATNRLDGPCPGGTDLCFLAHYDEDTGNQTGRNADGELLWDALGTMTGLHGAREERYVYDANDERILTISLAGTTETLHRYTLRGADNKVARELTFDPGTGSWSGLKDYVYRDGTLLASFSGSSPTPDRHYHVDHLGSIRLVTDGAGYKLALHTYYPFGREADGSEPDTERMKFTGHERDAYAGSPGLDLDYMHARYYDPNMGRFLSVDPTWESADIDDPQSWNRYTYAQNSPIITNDPDGELPHIVVCALVGAAVSGGLELVSQIPSGKPIEWRRVGAAAASGAVTGAVAGATGGLSLIGSAAVRIGATVAVNAASNAASGYVQRKLNGEATTGADVAADAAIGAVAGTVSGHFADKAAKSIENSAGFKQQLKNATKVFNRAGAHPVRQAGLKAELDAVKQQLVNAHIGANMTGYAMQIVSVGAGTSLGEHYRADRPSEPKQ